MLRYRLLLLALVTPVTGAAGQRITVDLSGTTAEITALTRAQVELARRAVRLVPAVTLSVLDQALSAARIGLDQAARWGAVEFEVDFETDPPAPWIQQDPADSLYRGARRLLNNGSYAQAAALFARIATDHPRSTYAPDAYYWQAYAQYRVGSRSSLQAGLTALEQQQKRFPEAGTRRDAESLVTRIRSRLAQSGDPRAREEIERKARTAADVDPDEAKERDEARRERDRDAEEARRERDRDRDQSSRDREQARREREHARRERSCDRDEDDDRMAALNALLQMDEDKALPILRRVLARRDSGSVCLRRKAVFLVSQHAGPESEAMLLAAARNDPDSEVRSQAVFWLSQSPGEHAVLALDSILRGSTDEELQEKALFALSQHDSPKAQQALRDYALKGTNPSDLREKAIFWIGQSDRPEGGAFLRQLFLSLRDENLKDKVIFSISQQGGKENFQWLLDIAAKATEDIEVRKKAIFWAGQGDASLPELFALYDRIGDRDIREQLIFTYSQRHEKAAVDRLILIARTEKDRELRKKAIFWLTQSNDPRVAQFLNDLLEKP